MRVYYIHTFARQQKEELYYASERARCLCCTLYYLHVYTRVIQRGDQTVQRISCVLYSTNKHNICIEELSRKTYGEKVRMGGRAAPLHAPREFSINAARKKALSFARAIWDNTQSYIHKRTHIYIYTLSVRKSRFYVSIICSITVSVPFGLSPLNSTRVASFIYTDVQIIVSVLRRATVPRYILSSLRACAGTYIYIHVQVAKREREKDIRVYITVTRADEDGAQRSAYIVAVSR